MSQLCLGRLTCPLGEALIGRASRLPGPQPEELCICIYPVHAHCVQKFRHQSYPALLESTFILLPILSNFYESSSRSLSSSKALRGRNSPAHLFSRTSLQGTDTRSLQVMPVLRASSKIVYALSDRSASLVPLDVVECESQEYTIRFGSSHVL